MSKYWVINVLDRIFVSVSIFLIIFAWINFYIHNLWATFWLSLLFSFAVVFLLFWFLSKKQEKKVLNKKQLMEIEKVFLAFRVLNKDDQLNLLKNIISKEHLAEKHGKVLTYSDEFGKHKVIVATNIKKIDNNDLINILNENNLGDYDCFDIFCNESDVINCDILKDKKIFIIDHKKLYFDYFLKHSTFPKTDNLNAKASKIKFKEIAFNMFSPNKAKTYFFCGLILIFSSIIIPYRYYYIIFGSMLLLFAVICKIMPNIKN